jgi:hypothetical protein
MMLSVIVFNSTFNNMSVISWQSFLLLEETEVPCRRSLTNLFYHIMLHRVDLAIVGFKLTKLVEIGTDYTGKLCVFQGGPEECFMMLWFV